MRRVLITFGLSLLIVSSAFAGNLVPYFDYFGQNDDFFSSPARLTEVSGVTHFAFDVTTFSGVDTLAFFSLAMVISIPSSVLLILLQIFLPCRSMSLLLPRCRLI